MKLKVTTLIVTQLLQKVEEKMITEKLESFTLPSVVLDGTASSLRTTIARVLKKDSGLQEIMADDDKAVLTCSVQNGNDKGVHDLVFTYMSPNSIEAELTALIATGFVPSEEVEQFTGTITAARASALETEWSQAIQTWNTYTPIELIGQPHIAVELDTVLEASASALQPVLDEAWAIARFDYQMWNSIDLGAEGYTLLYLQQSDNTATLTITKVEEILNGRATNGEEVRSLMAANT